MDEQTIREEGAYLAEVERILLTRLEALCAAREGLREKAMRSRRAMWENGRHAVSDFDDAAFLTAEEAEVAAEEDAYLRAEEEIARAEQMARTPYFARLDFEEEGLARTYYIGRFSMREEASRRMWVVDWRAPVASLFYDFDLGPGRFETAAGSREVRITRKRQFEIRDGRLELVYDGDSAMPDEILGRVLAQNTEPRLRVIVGSIQKEQNAAIRARADENCLIYGLAGSGKTSVGLHRLAYLLYHHRDTLRAENIRIFSGSRVFASYIASVLPELGERPAETVVFSELLSECLGSRFRIEPYYDQLRTVEAEPAAKRTEWIGKKYGQPFLSFCLEYFDSFALRTPRVCWEGTEIVSPTLADDVFAGRRFSTFGARRDALVRWAQERVEAFFDDHREEICRRIEEKRGEPLSKQEARVLWRKMRIEQVVSVEEEITRLNRLDAEKQLVLLLDRFFGEEDGAEFGAAGTARALESGQLRFEDAVLLLLVRVLMGETPARNEVRHIVLDEAQDMSPAQLLLLRRLYPKSSFTLLADVYQAVNPVTTVRDYDGFSFVFGGDLRRIPLAKCYRSSKEINTLAFRLLAHEDPAVPKTYSFFDRSAGEPQYVEAADPAPAVAQILGTLGRFGSVAVITNTEAEALALQAALPETLGAQAVASPQDSVSARIAVMPLLLAKGLEFDAVILVDLFSGNRGDPDLYRKAYLGCTRALHALWLVERPASGSN